MLHSLSVVELLGELSLLVVGSLLVESTLGGSLVNDAAGFTQQIGSFGSLGLNCSFELLNDGFHSRTIRTILSGVLLAHLHALGGGLDVRHVFHLLVINQQQ